LSNLDRIAGDAKVIETTNDALGNVYEVRVSGIARDGPVGQVKIAVMGDCFRHRNLFRQIVINFLARAHAWSRTGWELAGFRFESAASGNQHICSANDLFGYLTKK